MDGSSYANYSVLAKISSNAKGGKKLTIVNKLFILALTLPLSACLSISSSGETKINGERVVGNILSNGSVRRVTLDFAGREKCEGQYRGSTAIEAKQISLTCTNGKTGTATVDASQITNTASIRYNIDSFRKGSIVIPLGGQVSKSDTSSTQKKPSKPAVEEKKPSHPAATPTKVSSATLSSVRREVKQKMKDPDSIKFGQYKALKLFNNETKKSTIVICGKYNAKNSYGGYVGDKLFLAKKREDGSWSIVVGGMGVAMCSKTGFAVTVGGSFL